MRIECPTCETGFNVSDDQVGQKGLCPKCETKFIIPADPDDDIEVLAEGKIPAEKSKSEEKAKREKSRRSRDSEKDDDDEDDDDLDAAGGAGKAIGLLAIGLVIGLAIGFALGRMTAGGGAEKPAEGDGEKSATPAETSDPFGLD